MNGSNRGFAHLAQIDGIIRGSICLHNWECLVLLYRSFGLRKILDLEI